MQKETHGRKRAISDDQLRTELERGQTASEIAKQYGVSRQAIHLRVKQLGLSTSVAAVAPVESERYVARNLDAIEELVSSLTRCKLLMDACDAWLRDSERPEKYDIGPRTQDVLVTYLDYSDTTPNGDPRRKKAKLSVLLDKCDESRRAAVDKAETKFADPRELILKTAQEVRQTVQAAAELARMIADMRSMEAFREALLAAIAEVDKDVAERIVQAIRRNLVLQGALGEPASLRAG